MWGSSANMFVSRRIMSPHPLISSSTRCRSAEEADPSLFRVFGDVAASDNPVVLTGPTSSHAHPLHMIWESAGSPTSIDI